MTRFRLISTVGVCALATILAAPAIAGEVRGTVADASGTENLQAAEITIEELGRKATTARDGTYIFVGVPAGTYTLTARYVGADAASFSVDVPEEGSVTQDFSMSSGDGSIVVVGQRANQASALSRKRAADGVTDVLTRDAIGQFPDQNVAESLRRLPGINVLNDQGEGRFVSVRGLDPELNSSSLNGVRLPSPEGDTRSVALDVISSDIIESITVKKSLTPDMDADTIGASIEIETTSAFDRKKDLFTVKVEGSYNDLAGELTPKASFDFATKINDNFGISGGASYYNRQFETDNIEVDGWEDNGAGAFATEVQYRDYDVERERISATLGLDFRAGDSTELYLRGVYSQFDDQEFRRRLTFDLGDFDGGPSGNTGRAFTYSDADEEFTVERDVKDRFERQRIRSLVFGGESRWDSFFAEYSLAWSKSSEREDGSVDPTVFERDFDGDGLIVGLDFSDNRRPAYTVSGATDLFFDPAEYELNDVEFTRLSDSEDEEWAAQLDFGNEFYSDAGTLTLQGGVKARWRTKSFNKEVDFYELDDYTLDQVLGQGATYRIADLAPLPGLTEPSDFFFANINSFEFQSVDSIFDSAVEDYSVDEDIFAGYALARWETDNLLIIGGLRYERTSNDIEGNLVTLIEEDGTLPNGQIAGEDTVIITSNNISKEYDHWLPSLNVKFEAAPDVILRAAGYRSIVRPRLSRLAPRFAVEEADDGEREGEFGNPDLLPYEAWNLDATAEYYMSSNGAITAGVFYKDIKNYQIDAEFESDTAPFNGVFNGIAFDQAVIPLNGPSAEVFGAEFGFAQSFDHLEGFISGFIISANYTFTDATGLVPNDGDASDLRTIRLPAASKHTFNGALGYEKGPLSLRLAGTYRDGYLDELGSEADDDRQVASHFQLDFSARFRVNDNIKLFYEWVNINDAQFFAFNNIGGTRNNLQYEEYSWTMKGGVRVTF
ncbi:MAG: TonB-dependent receptor [Pseudomonadota bacterium]